MSVRYVYRCGCGARGTVQREDDSHDGAVSACTTCGAEVVLEWDGGAIVLEDGRVKASKDDKASAA